MNDEDSQKGHDINIRIFHITKNSTFGGRQFGSNVSNNYISFSNGGKRGEGQRPPPLCFYGKAGRLSQIFQVVFQPFEQSTSACLFFQVRGKPPPIFSQRGGDHHECFFGTFSLSNQGGSTSPRFRAIFTSAIHLSMFLWFQHFFRPPPSFF